MDDSMIYEVTKVEKTKEGFVVTAKDMDETKSKHRNVSSLVDDPTMFPVGSRVRFVPITVD